MKHRSLPVVGSAIAMAALSLNTIAGVEGNPYEVITLRNAFGLRPIPIAEPATPPTAPAAPRPEIKITGITTLLGTPRALFQYEDKEAKRTEFPPLLSEGESYKELTVMFIDAENSRVHIKNGDAEMTLDFFRNGVKPTASASIASAPVAAPATIAAIPDGRGFVAGPVAVGPGTTLPPALLARLQQKLQEQQQARQTEAAQHTAISPAEVFSAR